MRLEIPKPCTADWDKMKIGLRSRHCESCAKNVIDFRGQSKEEILLYLLQNRGTQTCGRFTKSQLDVIHLEEIITISALRQLPSSKAFAVLTMACLLLASCNNIAASGAQSVEIVSDTIISSPKKTNPVDRAANTILKADTSYVDPGPAPIDPEPKPEFGIEMGEVVVMGDVPEFLPEDSLSILEPHLQSNMPTEDTTIYTITEVMPEFPGGIDSLFSFLRNNIQYPADAKRDGVSGKVYAQIVMEKDGSISNPKILRGINGYKSFDAEVLRVISIMPNWTPGIQRGKSVRVSYNLPFVFQTD